MSNPGSTEKAFTVAQERVLGRFCSRCRRHKAIDGGRILPAGSGRTRWVCAPCLNIINQHKSRF